MSKFGLPPLDEDVAPSALNNNSTPVETPKIDIKLPKTENLFGLPPLEGGPSVVPSVTGEAFKQSQYDLNVPRYADLDEIRGERQVNSEKWRNGIVKMGGTALTTSGEALLDVFYGLPKALLSPLTDDPDDGFSSLFDTNLHHRLDTWTENLQKNFPTYYTQAELEKNALQGMGTANFWSDKVLNGLGFTIGAIGGAIATGGLLEAVPGLGTLRGNKLISSLAKMTTAERETAMAAEGIKSLDELNKVARNIKFREGFQAGANNLIAAHVESGIEARHGKKNFVDSEIQKIISEGRTPTQDELDEINSLSDALGNTQYLMNLPVVAGANFVEFSKILGKRFDSEIKQLSRSEQRSALDIAEGVSTKPLSTSRKAYNILKNPLAEATQELTQSTIEQGLQDYFDRKFDGTNQGTLDDMMSSFGTGLEKTFGTKEGIEQGLIGLIIGGVSTVAQKDQRGINRISSQRIQAAAEALKKYKMSEAYAPLYEAVTANMASQERSDEAVRSGDVFGYQNEKANKFYQYVQSRIQTGQFERMMEDFDSYDNMSDDAFKKTFGFEEGQPLPKNARLILEAAKDKSKELNKIHNNIDITFPNVGSTTRDFLKFASFRVSDIDEREKQLSEEVFNTTGIDYTTLRSTSPKTYKEDIESQFNKLEKSLNPSVVPGLKQKIQDLQKLSQEREKFIELFHLAAKSEETVVNAKKKAQAKGEEVKASKLKSDEVIKTAKKTQNEEVQKFYVENAENGFYNVDIPVYKQGASDSFGPVTQVLDDQGNPVTKKVNFVGFETKSNGEIDPNWLVDERGTKYSTAEMLKYIKPEHIFKLADAKISKDLSDRISAIQAVIDQDIQKGLESKKKIQETEDMLLSTLIEIEELQKYKQGKDSKFRKIGVKGSKVYTETEFRKVLASLISLKEELENTIKDHQVIREELVTNIRFLQERNKANKKLLEDNKNLRKVHFKSIDEQADLALQKIIDSDTQDTAELEALLEDSQEVIDSTQRDIDMISEYIDTLTKILERNDIETLVRTRNIFDSYFKAKYPMAQGFMFRLYNQETLSAKQRLVLSKELQSFSERYPEFKTDLENLNRLKTEIEEQQMRAEELLLTQQELENLQHLNSAYKKFQKEYKQVLDSQKFLKNFSRIKEALTRIQAGLTEQEQKTKTPKKPKKPAGGLTEPQEISQEEWDEVYQEKARRDYKDVLNGTAGSNVLGETNALTTDEAQLRWFKITENISISGSSDYTLRFITKESNPFGDEVTFDEGYENIIQAVLYKSGEPFRLDGKLVYTRLHETPSENQISRAESAKYNNKSKDSETEVQKALDKYSKFRETILAHTNKEEGLYTPVTGKSRGIQREGFVGQVLNRIVPQESDISKIDLVISLEETSNIQGQVVNTPRKGLVLIGHKGQVIPVKLARLSQIPGATERVMELIEMYTTSKDPKKVEESLKKIIFWGDHGGAVKKIYITDERDKIYFNGTFHDINAYDKDALRAFLDDKFLNVNTQYLKTGGKFTDPIKIENGKHKVWPSYRHFLMSSEGRTEEEIPIKVNLPSLDQQQFLNVYLKFDSNVLSDKSTPEIKEAVVTEEKTPEPKTKKSASKSKAPTSEEDLLSLFDQAKSIPGVYSDLREKKPDEPQTSSYSKDIQDELDKLLGNDSGKSNRLYQGEAPASRTELDEEEKWFKESFPKFTFLYDRVKGLIDSRAIGQLTEQGRVLISDLAAKGTTYHEAFHVVTQMLMTSEERQALYAEYRERTGIIGDVEENLAEEFRDFMLSEGTLNIPPVQKSWFEKLLKWIKEFFLGKTNEKDNIQTLFEGISKGQFANREILQLPSQKYNKNYLGKDSEYTKQAMELIASNFFDYLLDPSNATSISSLSSLDSLGISNLFAEVLNRVKQGYAQNFKGGVPIDVKMSLEDWNKLSFSQKESKSAIFGSAKNQIDLWKNWDRAILDFKNYLKQFRVNIEESEDLDLEALDSRDSADFIESIKFSTKDGAPDIVKLLIASLPKYSNGKLTKSSIFLGPELSSFDSNMNVLHNELSGLRTFSEMVQKIKSISKDYPQFTILLERLGVTPTDNTPANLTWNKVNLQIAFERQFDKTKNIFRKMLLSSDGDFYSVDNDEEYLKGQIRNFWKSSKSSVIYKVQDRRVIFDKQKLSGDNLKFNGKKYDPNNFSHVLSMLKLMGIIFTDDNFSSAEKENIIESARKIIEYSIKNPDVNSLFSSKTSSSSLDKLVQIEMAKRIDQVELHHINLEGETVYSITLNNYLSNVVNQIGTRGISSLEHLQHDLYSENSIWKKLIQNNKNAIKLSLSTGIQQNTPGSDGKITSKAQPGDLVVLNINNVLSNRFPFLRAGDRKLEYMLEINMDSELNLEEDNYLEVFKGFLKDEISKVQNREFGEDIMFFRENSSKLGVFDYLPLDIVRKINSLRTSSQVDSFVNSTEVQDAIKKYIGDQIKDNKEILERYRLIEKEGEDYLNNGIDNTIMLRYAKNARKVYASEMDRVIKDYTIKSLVANIEQTKLFTGSLDFFNHSKQEAPKRINSIASTKDMASVDPGINSWLSAQGEQYDGKTLDNTFNVATFDEIVETDQDFIDVTSKLLRIPASDAYFDAYRGIKVVDGQGYITLPEYRRFMFRMGNWSKAKEEAFNKAMKGERVNNTLFPPLKPQYYGPQKADLLYTPANLKLSLLPLIPSMIQGTPMEDVNEMLMSNQVGIAVFPSGNKIGAKVNSKNGKVQKLFDDKGELNQIKDLQVSTLYYDYFGTQLNINEKEEDEILTGTQFRKQPLTNLFTRGESKIIQVKDALTGETQNRDTKDIAKEWKDIISELTTIEKKELFERFNIQEGSHGTYKITDINKFRELIYEEALDRDLAENLLDGIQYSLSGDNPSLDVLVNKQKVENILNALVNNNLIKQKTSGSLKVLASSTGMTLKAKKDSSLKFYQNGVMEIKLPSYFKKYYKGVKIENLDPMLLNLVGYRIPTQGLAAIENIKVVGFLPDEAGDVILVPQAYPAKSGGDYDIDKLNLLFPNYKINYFDSKGKDLEASDELLQKINQKLSNKYQEDTTIVKGFDELDEIIEMSSKERSPYQDDIVKFYRKSLQESRKELEYIKGDYTTKRALQNRMLEISREILSSPNKAEELFTANSVDKLKELVKEIRTKKGIPTQDTNTHQLVEFKKQLKIAQDFWSGKQGVGIAALHSTGHILSQMVNLYIENQDTYINLPHNKVLDGKISLAGEYDAKNQNRISEIISQFLNGYVDIAKDPFIFDLNAGIQNANTWLYLIRAGVPLKSIGHFMAEDIIEEYLTELSINQAEFLKVIDESSSKLSVQNRIRSKYKGDKDKLQILEDYLHYSETAEALSSLQQSLSYDTKGVGKTRWTARASLVKFREIRESGFFGNSEKFITDTLLQPFHSVVKEGTTLFNEMYTADGEESSYLMQNLFKYFTEKGLRADEVGDIMSYAENELLTYLLQVVPISSTSLNAHAQRLMLDAKSLPIRVLELMKQEQYKDNTFLQQLLPLINENRSKPDNLRLFSRILNTYQSNQITDDFKKLKGVRDSSGELYQDLIIFSIIQSGLNNSPVNFIHIVPNADFVRLAKKLLKENLPSSGISLDSFEDQFFQNNYWKNEIVPYQSPMGYSGKTGYTPNLRNNNTQLMVWEKLPNSQYDYLKTYIEDPSLTAQERTLRKAQGLDTKIPKLFKKQSKQGTMFIYQEIPILGDRFLFKEYSLERKQSLVNPEVKITKNTPRVQVQVMPAEANFADKIVEAANRLSPEAKSKILKNYGAKTLEELKGAIVTALNVGVTEKDIEEFIKKCL